MTEKELDALVLSVSNRYKDKATAGFAICDMLDALRERGIRV